jgi:hypothetical protein
MTDEGDAAPAGRPARLMTCKHNGGKYEVTAGGPHDLG